MPVANGGGSDVGSPHWSPDGHTIAFDCLDSTSRNARYVYFISLIAASRGASPTERRGRCGCAAAQCHSIQFDIHATIQFLEP
jgi:hypothetical protein